MANEAEELAQRLLSLLGSRVPHHSRGAFGQTVGQESWRITATGDQLAVLDEAAALIRRQRQEYAMLDEVCAGLARDAARYRWLRDQYRCMSPHMDGNHHWAPKMAAILKGQSVDAAIDAEIASALPQREEQP